MVPSSRDKESAPARSAHALPAGPAGALTQKMGEQRAGILQLHSCPEVLTLSISRVFRSSVPLIGAYTSHWDLDEKALRTPRCPDVTAF